MAVSFDTPPVTGGQGSVTVDVLAVLGRDVSDRHDGGEVHGDRFAEPHGHLRVPRHGVQARATLSKTRYLAFGDSITAGEVTFPVGSSLIGATAITKQVVVPSAAYPTVLLKTLQGRYASQADAIAVANYGFGGEKVDQRAQPLLLGAERRPPGGRAAAGRPQRHSRRAKTAPPAAPPARFASGSRRRARAACACSSRRRRPARPGGNRTINPLLLVDYANRMRGIAAQEGAGLVDLYTRCCRTCSATSASTACIRTSRATRRSPTSSSRPFRAIFEVR